VTALEASPLVDRVAAAFERRAARAQALANESASARDPLAFAAGLYRAQGAMAQAVARAQAARPLTGRLDADLDRWAGDLSLVLGFVVARGPAPLATAAAALAETDPRERLQAFWNGDASGRTDYLGRALLRPYGEVLAAADIRPQRPAAMPGGCPFCGGPPWIAARRSPTAGAGPLISASALARSPRAAEAPAPTREPEIDGAQRVLGCGLCGGEWVINRVHCPACGEETPDKLPTFQGDRYPAARVEACATCLLYVKSIDLTLDARAIPEVDDLVSLAVDLWAVEQGYTRLEPGLAGV
jgi:hypothetical protein